MEIVKHIDSRFRPSTPCLCLHTRGGCDDRQRGKAVARPELGTKRVCLECGSKYYDLNRDPITCPKCGTIFEVAKPAPADVAEVDEPEEADVEDNAASEDEDAEVISLEDADAEQASSIEVPDLDDDDNSDDADVFLDDEEDEESLDAIGLDVAVPSGDDE